MWLRFKTWLHPKLFGHKPDYRVMIGGLFYEPYVYCDACVQGRIDASNKRMAQMRDKIKEVK